MHYGEVMIAFIGLLTVPICFIISIRKFLYKGSCFFLNQYFQPTGINPHDFADEDISDIQKRCYRQAGVIFLLVGILFLILLVTPIKYKYVGVIIVLLVFFIFVFYCIRSSVGLSKDVNRLVEDFKEGNPTKEVVRIVIGSGCVSFYIKPYLRPVYIISADGEQLPEGKFLVYTDTLTKGTEESRGLGEPLNLQECKAFVDAFRRSTIEETKRLVFEESNVACDKTYTGAVFGAEKIYNPSDSKDVFAKMPKSKSTDVVEDIRGRLSDIKINRKQYYAVGFYAAINMYVIEETVHNIAGYQRYYRISKREYEEFGTQEFDKLWEEIRHDNTMSDRFLYSECLSENHGIHVKYLELSNARTNTDQGIYTRERLDLIHDVAAELILFAETNDPHALPRCFGFLRTIVNNIELCKRYDYSSAQELSPLIREDWNSACSAHNGLMEYYIWNEDYEKRKALNRPIKNYIECLSSLIEDKYITSTNKENDELEEGSEGNISNVIYNIERNNPITYMNICALTDAIKYDSSASVDAVVNCLSMMKERIKYDTNLNGYISLEIKPGKYMRLKENNFDFTIKDIFGIDSGDLLIKEIYLRSHKLSEKLHHAIDRVKREYSQIASCLAVGDYFSPGNYKVVYVFNTDEDWENAKRTGITDKINKYHRAMMEMYEYPQEGIKDAYFTSQELCDREYNGSWNCFFEWHGESRKINTNVQHHDMVALADELVEDINYRLDSTYDTVLKKQLLFIKEEIIKLKDDRDYSPVFPHMIVDSWDMNDDLGIRLLEFADIASKTERRWKFNAPHFYCLDYTENGRHMIIDLDLRDPVLCISKNLITHWEPPYDAIVIDEKTKEIIYERLKEHLKSRQRKFKEAP